MTTVSVVSFALTVLAICQFEALAAGLPLAEHAQNPTTATAIPFHSDFVADDAEMAAILRRLEAEATNSIKNPQNFVSDDVPIDELIRNLVDESPSSRGSGTESTATPTTTTTSSPFPVVQSDEEFEAVLARLREEARNSALHPMNYVQDEADVEKLAGQIARSDDLEALIERWNSNKPIIYDPEECPICRSELEDEEQISLVDCKHTFHKQCLISWFQTQQQHTSSWTCPMCRMRVPEAHRPPIPYGTGTLI